MAAHRKIGRVCDVDTRVSDQVGSVAESELRSANRVICHIVPSVDSPSVVLQVLQGACQVRSEQLVDLVGVGALK